jgi:hypothetical protein
MNVGFGVAVQFPLHMHRAGLMAQFCAEENH